MNDGVSRKEGDASEDEAAKMKRRETPEESAASASAAPSQDHRPPEGEPTPPPPDRVLFQSFTKPLPIPNQTIIFTFRMTSYEEPQEGDWIGLFRVKQNIPDSCNDISFVWAKDESVLLSDGIYQTCLRLYNDEDMEPDALFCLSYVTTGCQFIGYSKKFWIQNDQIIPEDDAIVSDTAPKCHFICHDNDGNHAISANLSLNDWLAHISNTACMERNKMTKTQNGSDKIPDEFCPEVPKTTSSEKTWRTGSHVEETGTDDARRAGDETTLNKHDSEERRASINKPDVINVSFNVNNNINREKSRINSPAVDRRPNLATSVLKEKIAEIASSSDQIFPENPKESSSTSSAEAFFEAVNADDVFNSLYSELSIAHSRIEMLAEELKDSVVANELLKEELERYKSAGRSEESKDLADGNEHLIDELNSRDKRAEATSSELAELKIDFKMLSGELEEKKVELNEIQMLEAVRLSEIESLKEKLDAQMKEVKILRNLKTWESVEIKRLKSEMMSKQTELKLTQDQDRSKAADLKQLDDQLQTRCEEVSSIKALIQSQNHLLNQVRKLVNSKDSDDSGGTLDAASVDLNKTSRDTRQMELESGNCTVKKLEADLGSISDTLLANRTGIEQLKVEILGLLAELQRLQINSTTASARVVQLKETNDCKLEELASMKQQLSANFQKFHSNQMLLSTKLLRSKVNEQLLTKTLEKLRKKDEDSAELLNAYDETRKRCLDEKDALQQELLQLQFKSRTLEAEFQRNLVSREDVQSKLKVEEILTANLSEKLQQFEDKLNQSSGKLTETETKAENFLMELHLSRERESKLGEEMLQMRLRLETSLTDLRDSEESLRLVAEEAESLRLSTKLLAAQLEKSKTSEQLLLGELRRMSNDTGKNRGSKTKVSKESADFRVSRSNEKATKSGCYGNSIKPPVENTGGAITQHDETLLLSSSSSSPPPPPLDQDSSAEKDEKATKEENPSAVVVEKLSIEINKDLKAANASSQETLSNQSSTNNFSDGCKQNDSYNSNENNVIRKSSAAAAENKRSEGHVDGSTSQSNVIRELEQQVVLQSEEILQYQEKLESLLSEMLLQNQQFCCENGNGVSPVGTHISPVGSHVSPVGSHASPVGSLSARYSTAETACEQLRREQKLREDLLAWNELNNKQLMEHISMVQSLVSKSPVLIERLYNSSSKQHDADAKICTKDEPRGSDSVSGQKNVICSKESDSTAKSRDNAKIGNGIRNGRLHARDIQKLSNSDKTTDSKASALPRPSNNFRAALKRLHSGTENFAGEDQQQAAKSSNVQPLGRYSASTDDVKEATGVRMFRRLESQNLDARNQGNWMSPGLASRRQPSPSSSTAPKKLKEINRAELFRNGNAPTACSDPSTENHQECLPFDPPLSNQRPAKTAFRGTQPPKSRARYCASMPKTRTYVANNNPEADANIEREWFGKDQEHDAAYEALKRIGLNLNYFLESLTDAQPEKISLDFIQYPTAEDASDISDLDAYGDDFRIPSYHLVSSPASPEKSKTKTKYKPRSHPRELTFPRYVESMNRNLHVRSNAGAGANNGGANESLSSVSLFADNTVVASSGSPPPPPPRKEVVVVKTQQQQQRPKFFKMDSKTQSKKSASKRPKVKSVPEQQKQQRQHRHSLHFVCPLVAAAEGDATVGVDRHSDCVPAVVAYSRKCDHSAESEHTPRDTVAGGSSDDPVGKRLAAGVKRRPYGYADLINRRVVWKAGGKRSNQGAVAKRILPAKQPCLQVDRITKASN